MEDISLVFSGLLVFFVAYVAFILFAYKVDPRFSLKYKKSLTFQYLLLISTLDTLILVFILICINLLLGRNLLDAFSLNNFTFTWQEISLGTLIGVLLFILLLPIDMLLSVFRRKFLSSYKSEREDEVKRLVLGSLPKSQWQSFALLLLTSIKAAMFEEVIFRGYLTSHLLLLTIPVIAVVMQAFLFFIPHLYQGIFNAILPFIFGFFLGLIFFLTGSLTIVTIAHFIGDLIGLLVQATLMKKAKVLAKN